MHTRITFGHKIRNHHLEELIEEQVRCVDKYAYRTSCISVVVDIINNVDKVCHISFQVSGEPALDICKVRPGVMMAVMSAFEELEEKLQHRLIQQAHWERDYAREYFPQNGALPVEATPAFFPTPTLYAQTQRRMRRH